MVFDIESETEFPWKYLYPVKLQDFRLLDRTHLLVQYKDIYSRRTRRDLEENISTQQREFLQSPNLLTNEPGYRLAGVEYRPRGLTLHIGPTNYFDYIAFQLNKNLLQDKGLLEPEKHELYLPNLIGSVGVVLTSDRVTYAVVRSNKVATYKGFLDFPGGHPRAVISRPDLSTGSYDKLVRDELFSAAYRETAEDLGIEHLFSREPLLLAVLLNLANVMKPDIAFLIITPYSHNELQKYLELHAKHHYEVDNILAFDPFNVENSLSKYRMTPIMAGTLSLLQKLGPDKLESCIT